MVSPSLRKTEDSTLVFLDFDKPFPELFSALDKITALTISGLNSSQYTYNLSKSSSFELSFVLKFAFKVGFTKYPTLTVSLNPSVLLEHHKTHRLTRKVVTTIMKSYFRLDEATQELVDKAEVSTESGGYISSASALIGSFTSSGSGLAFRSLLLMDLIKFLK